MEHLIYHLNKAPFDLIKKGAKSVEYRLNDAKRQRIKIDDIITFYLRPEDKEKIVVKVTDLKYYKDLLDMYTDSFNLYLYKNYAAPQKAVEDTTYYSKEEIDKYGCVAIFFKIEN